MLKSNDRKSSTPHASCSVPPERERCQDDPENEGTSSPDSPSSLPGRLDRIQSTFERCRLQGLQAPSLTQLDQIVLGSIVSPYND